MTIAGAQRYDANCVWIDFGRIFAIYFDNSYLNILDGFGSIYESFESFEKKKKKTKKTGNISLVACAMQKAQSFHRRILYLTHFRIGMVLS